MADNKNTKPALDLTTLVPVAAAVPAPQRTRKHRDNPFTAWLAETFESGDGKSVTVPAANVGEVEYLIRCSADELGIGARVVVTDSKGAVLDKESKKTANGNLTVLFAGKDRRVHKPKDATAEATPTA